MIEVISNKVVKTRKAHRCCICIRKFEPGSQMEAQTYKYDEITTSYCCETCKALINENFIIPDDDECFGMYTSESLEWAKEFQGFKGTPEEFLSYVRELKASAGETKPVNQDDLKF